LPGPYFFTICTQKHKDLFYRADIRNTVINVFRWTLIKLETKLHTLVVATDHIHGILSLPEGNKLNLAQVIGSAKVKTTQTLKERYQMCERIWQRSYYDHVMRDEKDFIQKAKYIENHPLKEKGNQYAEWH